MNLAETIVGTNEQSILLASNAVANLWVESQNGKRILVKRPKQTVEVLLGFAKGWMTELEIFEKLSHPNLLKTETLLSDGSLQMERTSMISLHEFMADNPSFVTRQYELERIIYELMDVLEYMHGQGVYAIDLSPHSILLTRSGHTVKLFSICSPYLSIRKQLWTEQTAHLAPEIQNVHTVCNAQTDIYALSKVIEFLFFNGKLPYKYKKVVERSQNTDPALRFENISILRVAIGRQAQWNNIRNGLLLITGVGIAVTGIIKMTTSNETDAYEHVSPALNSDNTISVIEARQQYGVDEESSLIYLNDSIITNEDWTISDSIRNKLSDIFRRQFRKKAEPILHKIYNKSTLTDTKNSLQMTITQGYEELKQAKDQLVQECGLDAITADTIAAEIISRIATELLEQGE